ncbi:MHO_1590 family protein [Metamycoplasma alkalescens]|uniref:Lipoprotein n=2 Tax=Metamycoplasma alkalescens TaxID=45363 RepID=A0A318U5C1_9BACT|nr:hypothetical protein [Metamycoplasma alkalescens]PYF43166.1 hypothetical protein BCF88_10433 [Metamycoplasma alkalescens]
MKEKKKKIWLWLGISSIVAIACGLAATFVILQQKSNKKDANKINQDNKKPNNPNENKNNEDSKISDDSKSEDQNNSVIDDKNQDEDQNIIETKNKKDVPWKEIFPEIKSSDYYEKLNYRNGQAWIDEEMIVYIIKDVLNRMLVIDGEVDYAYKQIDDQNLLITFKWNNDKQKSVVSYKISTNKL